MTIEKLCALAQEIGFEHAGKLDPATIELKEEVREMCASGKCAVYDKRWSCPPGCGTLDECRELLKGYTYGVLVQSVGELEDNFDIETMMETEATHKERFYAMRKALNELGVEALGAGAGCCTVCKECTYPDAPCRFPEQKMSSMEALGMLVLEVCKANDMQYFYGENTIAYTSCFLLK